MILFDPEQSEAVEGFPGLVAAGAKLPAKATLLRYLREAQGAVGLKGEVSVLLTTDDGIRGLNRRFRKKNKATDVLSFPADAEFARVTGVAGDLAISVETAARQAADQGHRLSVELRVLMLHGLLHLAGMDHEADEGQMARRESRLRAKLRLPLGLIERVESPSGAKAPARKVRAMYGLKPVPSVEPNSSKPVPSVEPNSSKSVPSGEPGSSAMCGLKPVPSVEPGFSKTPGINLRSNQEPTAALRRERRPKAAVQRGGR